MTSDLDHIIDVCNEYNEILKVARDGGCYSIVPSEIVDECLKLKALGMSLGDKWRKQHFSVNDRYYISNSKTGYKPEKGRYYVIWDNGNIGRLQFVSSAYYAIVQKEWDEFKNELMKYNPVDYDEFNCRNIYTIEDGKRLMADYDDICNRTLKKMRKKIAKYELEKKKEELKKLEAEVEE